VCGRFQQFAPREADAAGMYLRRRFDLYEAEVGLIEYAKSGYGLQLARFQKGDNLRILAR